MIWNVYKNKTLFPEVNSANDYTFFSKKIDPYINIKILYIIGHYKYIKIDLKKRKKR